MVSLFSFISFISVFWCQSNIAITNTFFPLQKQDTVIDAGMYDGSLGIICAISALKVLKVTGKLQRLTRPVEVREFSSVSSIILMLLSYHILMCFLAPPQLVNGLILLSLSTSGSMSHMRPVDPTLICVDLVCVLCLSTLLEHRNISHCFIVTSRCRVIIFYSINYILYFDMLIG